MKKNLISIFFIILTPIIIYGQSNCEVCNHVDQLKKEIFVLKHEIEKIKHYTNELENELKNKDIKINFLRKKIGKLEKALIDVIAKLNDTNIKKDKFYSDLVGVTADYKKDTSESKIILRNYQVEIEKEKKIKDSLYSKIGEMEKNYNKLKSSLANIWTKNLPLNIDSTFIVPYDQEFVKINYRKHKTDDYRLTPDEYSYIFMNNLKTFLKHKPTYVTLIITIEGKAKDRDPITRSIKNQLLGYIDSDSYEITFTDVNRSTIYFRFNRGRASKTSKIGTGEND